MDEQWLTSTTGVSYSLMYLMHLITTLPGHSTLSSLFPLTYIVRHFCLNLADISSILLIFATLLHNQSCGHLTSNVYCNCLTHPSTLFVKAHIFCSSSLCYCSPVILFYFSQFVKRTNLFWFRYQHKSFPVTFSYCHFSNFLHYCD